MNFINRLSMYWKMRRIFFGNYKTVSEEMILSLREAYVRSCVEEADEKARREFNLVLKETQKPGKRRS